MAYVTEDDVEEGVARLESDVAHIRADIGDMKVDIRELRHEIRDLKDTVSAQIGSSREADASLRTEMYQGFTSLRAADASVRVEIVKSDWATRIWMVCLIGVVLSVMAHGFHWI